MPFGAKISQPPNCAAVSVGKLKAVEPLFEFAERQRLMLVRFLYAEAVVLFEQLLDQRNQCP